MGEIITSKIERINSICIDTAPFIYLIEENPRYIADVSHIFEKIDEGMIDAITSSVSLIEILVKPMEKGQDSVVQCYKELILNHKFLRCIPLDYTVAEKASKLRAKYNGHSDGGFKIKTVDAIQIATAIINKADLFLTNDHSLKNVSEIEILVLDHP